MKRVWARRGAGAFWRLAVAGLLLGTACASRQPQADPQVPQTVVDLNGESSGSGPTKVRVENQNLAEMTIYVYRGSQRIRLGRASGNTSTSLVIPSSIVSGVTQLRFYAEPMGNQRGLLSEPIPVQPGDLVDFYVPSR